MTTTRRYLDPTNDLCFKRVFSDKNRLMDFLNAILRLPEGQKIVAITFIPTEEVPDVGQGKRSLFDLKVQDQSGTWFVIEMQNRRKPHYLKRVQYYGSHAYVSQLRTGGKYPSLLPVVVVSVLREPLFPDSIGVVSYHRTLEEETHVQHLFALSYVFVELSKFKKNADELATFEDEWLYFLKSAEDTTLDPDSIKDVYVKDAFSAVERFNWSDAEYDAYVRASLLLDGEESALEEAMAQGEIIGEVRGEARGRAEGERSKAITMAKSCFEKGLDIQMVSSLTGLTEEELASLAKGG